MLNHDFLVSRLLSLDMNVKVWEPSNITEEVKAVAEKNISTL